MSPFHWVVILVVVLVVLGPKEGVKAARNVGRTVEQVRRSSRQPVDELLAHVSKADPGDDDDEASSPRREGLDETGTRRDPRT